MVLSGLGFLWTVAIVAATPSIVINQRRFTHGARLVSLSFTALAFFLAMRAIISAAFEPEIPVMELAGAVFAASIWLWLGLAINGAMSPTVVRTLWHTLAWIITVQGALTLGAMTGLVPMVIRTPLWSYLGNIASLEPWLAFDLARVSWFGIPILRSAGIQAEPVWAGGLAGGYLLAATLAGRHNLGMGPVLFGVASICATISLFLSYSRATWILFFTFLVLAMGSRHFRMRSLIIIAVPILLGAIIYAAYVGPEPPIIDALDELRPGSSEARLSLYRAAMTDRSLGSVLYGHGVKYETIDGLPIGSHSTPLSIYYRGGILALTLLIAGALSLGWWVMRSRDFVLYPIVFVGAWTIFEDFDVGHLMPLILIAVVSLHELAGRYPVLIASDRTP